MRPKLTQYLIDKGYVTESQCQEALQRQVVFGGRLGTNLLELCYISEQQLLEGLSKTLRAPVADLDKINIPQEVLEGFPAELAQKHKVIPFEETKNRLHVAMIEPNNLEAIDEISFITGKYVKPFVGSELRISYLLEEYYDVTRTRTFIALPEELEKRRQAWEERHREAPPAAADMPTEPLTTPVSLPVEQEEIELSSALPTEIDLAEPAALPPLPLEAQKANEAPAPQPKLQVPTGPPPLDFSVYEDCSQALADARNREDIGNVLMAFARSRMDRVVLFIIKGDEVQTWRAGGKWENPRRLKSLKFSAKEASVVHHVNRTGEAYQGAFLDLPAHRKIIETLGEPFPQEIAAMPLTIRKRVISVLVGDNSITGADFTGLQDLQRLTMKAAIAFEILILKAKILFK